MCKLEHICLWLFDWYVLVPLHTRLSFPHRVCCFSCARAVIPLRLGRHFLQLVSFIANQKKRKEPILSLQLLWQRPSLKRDCFEIAWPQLVKLTFNMIIVVIFTYLQGKTARELSTDAFLESVFHVTLETTVQTRSISPSFTSGLPWAWESCSVPLFGLSPPGGYANKGIQWSVSACSLHEFLALKNTVGRFSYRLRKSTHPTLSGIFSWNCFVLYPFRWRVWLNLILMWASKHISELAAKAASGDKPRWEACVTRWVLTLLIHPGWLHHLRGWRPFILRSCEPFSVSLGEATCGVFRSCSDL